MCGKQAEAGYLDLTGLDYSQPAVELATLIAKDKGLIRDETSEKEEEEEEEEESARVSFEQVDILSAESSAKYAGAYDVLCDKGTYDAISLHSPGPHSPFHSNFLFF